MGQNLKDLFKNQPKDKSIKMSEGHEARFLDKLDKALPQEKKSSHFGFLNIAASVIVLLGLSYGAVQYFNQPVAPITPTEVVTTQKLKTMGDISPDLKKVEDYYLASINLKLSKVKLTPENKDLVDGYIARLKELNAEYNNLTVELNENGPNTETLDALIDNLKFRLNLVTQLKDKLKGFNSHSFEEVSI
ncbi:MAG: hypothetical protein HKP48_08190 [Winogradskyella sp.]|uniref:hypothetical protein n=1 Tax=Winogradskyella sp. TaxID=1883156 RepID=UPI00182F6CA0|nr:hypothetical protein [Winogradskyella sp.]MBT8245964.1 hypothetical protein [Winogradskyella sp.]NNK23253.1 hypothetical protein [Winogradskyella sp.]